MLSLLIKRHQSTWDFFGARIFFGAALILWGLAGCASKPPAPTLRPWELGQTPQMSSSQQADPTPPNVPNYSSQAEYEKSKDSIHVVPHVALVVGGIGVPAFATVGLLKRFAEERISVDLIVSSGWASVFALGHGFSRSIHDLEWFSQRLDLSDFERMGRFDEKSEDPTDFFTKLVRNTFGSRRLDEAKIPIVLDTSLSNLGVADPVSDGDWKDSLVRSVSIPGLFRPFPNASDKSEKVEALNWNEALRRGAKTVVILSMYADYMRYSLAPKKVKSDAEVNAAYSGLIKSSAEEARKETEFIARIDMAIPAAEFLSARTFAKKRMAIRAGYKEGIRLAREIKKKR